MRVAVDVPEHEDHFAEGLGDELGDFAVAHPQSLEALAVGDAGHQSKGAVAFVAGGFYVKLAAFEAKGQALLPKVAAELAAALKPKAQ